MRSPPGTSPSGRCAARSPSCSPSPCILAGTFGGLRVHAERAQADNYAATASQVTVLGPAVEYLAAAEHAAIVARAVGINDPKLDEAQQEVVEAGARLVEARDQADLTPTQLRQVNDVLSLSEQMRTGMAYVSVTSSVSQVRQLERGVTQVISTIVDEQTKPEERAAGPRAGPRRPALALAAADPGLRHHDHPTRSSCTPSSASSWRPSTVSPIALGQTDPRVLEIRQANAQRVVNARGGNTKITGDDATTRTTPSSTTLLTTIDNNLATAARDARC